MHFHLNLHASLWHLHAWACFIIQVWLELSVSQPAWLEWYMKTCKALYPGCFSQHSSLQHFFPLKVPKWVDKPRSIFLNWNSSQRCVLLHWYECSNDCSSVKACAVWEIKWLISEEIASLSSCLWWGSAFIWSVILGEYILKMQTKFHPIFLHPPSASVYQQALRFWNCPDMPTILPSLRQGLELSMVTSCLLSQPHLNF